MKLYQVLDAFINSISHSSLFSVWEQTKTCSYEELIDFFKEDYLNQDLILESKDKLFNANGGYLVIVIMITKIKQLTE